MRSCRISRASSDSYTSAGRRPASSLDTRGARRAPSGRGRVADRSIAVTGAASGLGRAMALAFAAEGARVVVGDVRRDQLYVDDGVPTDQLITDAGGVARFVEADASKATDIDRMIAAALEFGDLGHRLSAGRDRVDQELVPDLRSTGFE